MEVSSSTDKAVVTSLSSSSEENAAAPSFGTITAATVAPCTSNNISGGGSNGFAALGAPPSFVSNANSSSTAANRRAILAYCSPKHSQLEQQQLLQQQQQQQQQQQHRSGSSAARHNSGRLQYPIQFANYDSGFGSTLSGTSGSGYSSSLGSSFLPPPPPYRMNAPKTRYRIHRSFSDSKYNGHGLDMYHISPRSSWSTMSRSPSPSMSSVSCPEYGDLQDKLHRLEADRESLSLQVSVLTEQVGAQTDKIKDLESLLDDKREKLDSTEEMLQEELVTRSDLETNKLDLLGEISNLKLKLAAIERDKLESEQRMFIAQNEIAKLQKLVHERNPEEVVHHHHHRGSISGRAAAPAPAPATIDQTGEIEQLRTTVQQLMFDNVEKERRIGYLKSMVHHNQGLTTSTVIRNVGDAYDMNQTHSNNLVRNHSSQNGQIDINRKLQELLAEDSVTTSGGLPISFSYPNSFCDQHPLPHSASFQSGPAVGSMPSSTSYTSTLSGFSGGGPAASPATNSSTWSAPDTPSRSSRIPLRSPQQLQQQSSSSSETARQLAAELDQLAPQYRRSPMGLQTSASLPRVLGQKSPKSKYETSNGFGNASSGEFRQSRSTQPLKWLKEHFRPSKRSTSAPNLDRMDMNECGSVSTDSDDDTVHSARQYNDKFKRDKKQRSLRNFISKLKRSNSQELHENEDSTDRSLFKRGIHARNTAGPRVRAWSREPLARQHVPLRPSFEQFCQWGTETLCDWLNELGLNMYLSDCSRNIRSGRHMMKADMEKELGIRNHLHRKKLVLALRCIEMGKTEPADQMDYHQVLRWLDDVGLPQYRDVFAEARVDGSVLNMLTVDDLLQLRINNALHHAAIARGIQILRDVAFNLSRLQRKFNADVLGRGPCPNAVQYWTQHFVSEWLRTIDLTEFIPNLMCAGVHGALMVLEPTFTAESLAAVLQIPPQKSLLRRHLTTHFNELLGHEVIAKKREVLSHSHCVQLLPNLKVKTLKKGVSLSRKKSRTDVFLDPEDLVCPLTPTRRPPASAALVSVETRIPESISEQILSNLESSNV